MRAYLIGFMAVMTACVAPAPVEQTVPADLSSAQGQVQVETESPATTSPGASAPEGTKPLPNGPADDPSTSVAQLGQGTQRELEPLDEPEVNEGTVSGGNEVGLLPALPAPRRVRKRMNLDQLNAAIIQATGGIAWTASNGKNEFSTLALTLGKPNYTDVTNEDLLPGALFQKFLSDAANSVCKKLVDKEKNIAKASARVLMRKVGLKDTITSNPKGVDANLVWLIKRFHSRSLAQTSQELEPYRFLFQAATKVSGGKPDQAWRAVCVTLIQHPHFYTY